MPSLALSPVSVGVYNALNVSGLTALVSTRIYDDVPQGATFPFVLYTAQERETRGFGTGSLPLVDLRVHAFSTYAGMKDAQSIAAKVVELLKDQTLTVSGYVVCGRVFYDDTVVINESIVNGVKCKEIASNFRVYVEPS